MKILDENKKFYFTSKVPFLFPDHDAEYTNKYVCMGKTFVLRIIQEL